MAQLHDTAMAQLHGAARFRIDRELADTLQGRIYAGIDRMTNRPAVIKEAWRQLVNSGYSRKGHRVPEDFISERRMIMRLSQMADCQGIAKGIGQWDDEHCHYYAMEHCEAELFDFISKHHQSARYRQFVEAEARKKQVAVTEPTEWTQKVASMFKQICSAVHWMHSKGFCHLDLSLENTMISDLANLKVKIIDLGLTKEFPDGNFLCRLGRVGKLQYMCPEAYARRPFDARKADVYCLGVMLFMMLIGAPPYQAPQPQNAAFRYIVGGKIADVLKHWKRLRLLTEDAVDLLTKMLCYEQHRISMADILDHPFLADIGADEVEEEKSATDAPSSVMMMNEAPDPMGQIEQKVSNMSIDDDSRGVNSQQEKPSMNAMDQKDESHEDEDRNLKWTKFWNALSARRHAATIVADNKDRPGFCQSKEQTVEMFEQDILELAEWFRKNDREKLRVVMEENEEVKCVLLSIDGPYNRWQAFQE